MSITRRVASLIYPRRIELFDRLNLNTTFRDVLTTHFANSTEAEDRYQMCRHVHETLVKDVAITYLEFGVWKGDSIANWAKMNTHVESRFYGFDTFTGLPEDWNQSNPRGAFNVDGNMPVIKDSRVTMVPGLFQESLYTFLASFKSTNPIVIHVDCDLYSSALFVLTALDRVLPPGTIVIFDEFFDLQHEFAAFLDYTQSFYRQWRGLAHTRDYIQVAITLV
jgi:O-methyltransferase